jgi:hypothetical protein
MWDLQDGRGLQYVNLSWMEKITGIKVTVISNNQGNNVK